MHNTPHFLYPSICLGHLGCFHICLGHTPLNSPSPTKLYFSALESEAPRGWVATSKAQCEEKVKLVPQAAWGATNPQHFPSYF